MKRVAKTVIERNGKYLLVKRRAGSSLFSKQWDLPGGKIEENETAPDAAVREAKEETSLKVGIKELVLEGSHTEGESQIHYKIFSTEEPEGDVSLSKDHTEFMWVTKEEMTDLKVTPFVEKYFENMPSPQPLNKDIKE